MPHWREAIELIGTDGLFDGSSKNKLECALKTCEILARRHDCVVANPPYMGSSSFGPFMSKWVKKNYPDVKSDLCTCFIERGFNLAGDRGYAAMITMQSWMFLGSFEKMRSSLIGSKLILSMLHLGPRAFDAIGGEVVNVTTHVVYNGRTACEGAYVRLVDINGSDAKRKKALEAIQNPDCDWFYCRDAETFKQIPGTPIAYWASDGLISSFKNGKRLGDITDTHLGMATCDNERFLRLWWEVGDKERVLPEDYPYSSPNVSWVPYNKGGIFRKWYGNDEYVVNWSGDGKVLAEAGAVMVNEALRFRPMISWTRVSSGSLAVRLKPSGFMFDMTGPAAFGLANKLKFNAAFLNSSVGLMVARFLSASLDFQPGQIATYPIIQKEEQELLVNDMVDSCRELSKTDWDSFETSWDFKHHPMI